VLLILVLNRLFTPPLVGVLDPTLRNITILADITTQELSSSFCSAAGVHDAAAPAVGGVAVLAGAMLHALAIEFHCVSN
jgi:hypothetical protein